MPRRSNAADPETIRRAGEGARLGLKYELLAAYCDIATSTLYQWLKDGRAGREPYVKFAQAVDDAESKGAAGLLAKIHTAANGGQWQAAAWILERRWAYRRDADPIPQVQGVAQTREEAIEQLAKLPDDLLLDAIRKKREGP